MFFQVLIASGPTAGFSSNYDTRFILPLPISTLSLSSLRSLEAEKRLPEFRGGFVYLGHKTGIGGLGVWGSKTELPLLGLQHTKS